MEKRILRKFKTFDLWEENVEHGPRVMKMEIYRSKNGDYICARHRRKRPGLIKTIARLEISPEPAAPDESICSVGKSAKDNKWYGWSHRAVVGFGLGDMIFEEKYTGDAELCEGCRNMESCEGLPCPSSIPFVQHGTKPITNDEDARLAAARFADYVS